MTVLRSASSLFAIGILLSIALHEVGHLVPAKRFGVKVTQYMVGFGPTMWSARRGETEYGLKWIPLGGYIRMIGMFPPGRDGTPRAGLTGVAGADRGRPHQSAAEVRPGDEDRVFYKLVGAEEARGHARRPDDEPAHRRGAVHDHADRRSARLEPTTSVGRVSPCIVEVTSDQTDHAPSAPPTDEATPAAAAAGLQEGDTIVAYDGPRAGVVGGAAGLDPVGAGPDRDADRAARRRDARRRR